MSDKDNTTLRNEGVVDAPPSYKEDVRGKEEKVEKEEEKKEDAGNDVDDWVCI
jgi:hypothetical protein